MPRLYRCADCKREFPRKDVVPPVGAVLAPGSPRGVYRCKPCHTEHLMDGFRASRAARLRGKPRYSL